MDENTWDSLMKAGTFWKELDWLAVDNKGQLGIFTALMNAPIPGKVKLSFKNYDTLRLKIESIPKTTSAIVETHEKGNFGDWVTYADKGFFAFDFQDVSRKDKKNQYDLIARPAKPLTVDDLNLPLLLRNSLFEIDCDFGEGDVKTDKIK